MGVDTMYTASCLIVLVSWQDTWASMVARTASRGMGTQETSLVRDKMSKSHCPSKMDGWQNIIRMGAVDKIRHNFACDLVSTRKFPVRTLIVARSTTHILVHTNYLENEYEVPVKWAKNMTCSFLPATTTEMWK